MLGWFSHMELNQSKINEIHEFMSLYSLSNSPFIEDDMEMYDEYKSMSDEEFCSEVDGRMRWLNTYYFCSSRFKELTDLFRVENRDRYNDELKKILNTFSAEQLNYIADNHNFDESPRILEWVIDSECCTVDVINTIWHLMLLDDVEDVNYTDEELAFIEKLKSKKHAMSPHDLRRIFEQIVSITSITDNRFDYAELCELTTFDGLNSCLNDSLVIHKWSGTPEVGRVQSFEDGQELKGDYLLFDYCAHQPHIKITQYGSFDELIDWIMSEGGILNAFTTLQVPIINGKAKDILFALKYTDKTSFEQTFEAETVEKIRSEIIKICKED